MAKKQEKVVVPEETKLTDAEIDKMQRPEGVTRQQHRKTIRRVEKIRDKMVKDPALAGAVLVLMRKAFNPEDLNISYHILKHVSKK